MDPQTFLEVATVVTKLKMYPYFDVANYILMCLMVRDDNLPQSPGELQYPNRPQPQPPNTGLTATGPNIYVQTSALISIWVQYDYTLHNISWHL